MSRKTQIAELPGRVTDPVRSITAFEVLWADPDDSLTLLAQQMRMFNCGAMLLTSHGDETDAGDTPPIVSERDLLRAIADGKADLVAQDLATIDPVSIDADAQIGDAAATMAIAGVRHLVVTDGDRHGIVSVRDLLEPLLASAIE